MATAMKIVCIIIEVSIILSVAVISVCMRQFLNPVSRGFFKDDESLMHPYSSSTVANYILYSVGFSVPLVTFLITEGVYMKLKTNLKPISLPQCRDIVVYFDSVYKVVVFFVFGAACTHFLTNIGKYSIGRLRPHFFDVCNPDWSKLNSTLGYIETNICRGSDPDLIQEARLSFPSGHSSMSMYCAVYFIVYVEQKLIWKGVTLLRPLIHTIAFSLAFYTCLSRISDYKHHWSDVLAGGILGLIIGLIMAWKWTNVNNCAARESKYLSSSYLDYPTSNVAHTLEMT